MPETPPSEPGAARAPDGATLREIARVFLGVGLTSFGGPAGQIALLHRVVVEERRWLPNDRFLHALNYCMLLPGPEAQQLATYVGWLRGGVRGGLISGGLFILPGAIAVIALSVAYARWGALPAVTPLLGGLKAAVLAIVVLAMARLARRALMGPREVALAVASFFALTLLALPFPVVVLASLALGALALQRRPADASPAEETPAPRLGHTLRVVGVGAALWLAPLAGAALTLGAAHSIAELGVLFAKTALVTFGGAYAVLGYVGASVTTHRAWLSERELADGLGLAETTPGPLILVLTFVGCVAAHRSPGALPPTVAAILGGVLATWVTFVPSFVFIFAGAPHVERLRRSARLSGALAGVTAGAVGVMANLALWFATHVSFRAHVEADLGLARAPLPVLSSLDPAAAIVALAAGALLGWTKLSAPAVLGLAAVAGVALGALLG